MMTETVADLANEAISQRYQACEHPLEMAVKAIAEDESVAMDAQADAIWEHLPTYQRSSATENVNVYLDKILRVFWLWYPLISDKNQLLILPFTIFLY